MKSRLLLFAAVLAAMSFTAKGQEFLPFVNDNYAGITGVHLNPASIANSRYIVDVSLAGFSLDAYNNYLSFSAKDLIKSLKDGDSYDLKELLNGKKKWANMMASAHALNFMFSITPKVALGFTNRVRFFANVLNFDENVATYFYNDRDVPALYYDYAKNNQYTLDNMSINISAFAEYGVTLAGALWESPNKKHFLKAGITGKVLQGLGAMYLNTDQTVFEFYNRDSLSAYGNASKTTGSNISYGMSENFNRIDEDAFRFNINSKRLGAAFDIGFVYEWRPDGENYMEEMDCKVGEMKYANKYKLRIGLSVTDIGWLSYKKHELSNNFVLQGGTNVSDDFDHMENVDGSYINGVNQRLNYLFATNPAYSYGEQTEYFRSTLPMAISLQVDYHIWNGFYLNFTPFVSLYQGIKVKEDVSKIRSYTIVSITPRFEHKWFGFSMPLQYNQLSRIGFALGVGLRLGPLWIGTNDLIGLCSKDVYGMNVQVALKVPIMYNKKRDSDGDHISNRKDMCPYTPGVCEYNGCPYPDRDGDGVPDYEDECPNTPGLPELKGCPDRDGDGVPDHLDECPDVPGLPELKGCPDRDGDGIPDHLDACPDKPGPEKWNGCPDSDGDGIPDHLDACPDDPGIPELKGCPETDTDGDGIPDKLDECPNVKGLPEFNGCPDRDGDGVPDHKDDCPDVPGLVSLHGCPDRDGDGVPDHLDECPDEFGSPEKHGCPTKVPIDFANRILFETGKATITPNSYPLLDSLVIIMRNNPDSYVTVHGHTDNTGKADLNLTLSQKRADAIKNYLLNKGIADAKVVTRGFGDTVPIADNKTPEGRAKNRRTEINLATP